MTDENGWKSIARVARANGMTPHEKRQLFYMARHMKPGERRTYYQEHGNVFDFEVQRRPAVIKTNSTSTRLYSFIREFPFKFPDEPKTEPVAPTLPKQGESVTPTTPAAAEVKPDITLADAFVVAADMHRLLALSPSLEGNNRRLAHLACFWAIRKLELDARRVEATP